MERFRKIVKKYYESHKRALPWRETADPYRILVSETMLQQTQVERVKGYYDAFLKKFPTTGALAKAPLPEVLKSWKGLGYNRRAVNLKRACEIVTKEFRGKFPKEFSALIDLPGIGQSTAGAIMNFSYNIPTAFIETNIRSVFLHHFFKGKTGVTDKEIFAHIEKAQDTKNPREWYYALYDYGTHLKKTIGNQNARSASYKKQSTFKGSNRELRSLMLSYLLEKKRATAEKIAKDLNKDKSAVLSNLGAFEKEGVVSRKGRAYSVLGAS